MFRFLLFLFLSIFIAFGQHKNEETFEQRFSRKILELIQKQKKQSVALDVVDESVLISLTGDLVFEIKLRNPNYIYASTAYFVDLERKLIELNALIIKFKERGATDLVEFGMILRSRIKRAIRTQEVNHKKIAFYTESISLLRLAGKVIDNTQNIEGIDIGRFSNLFNRQLRDIDSGNENKEQTSFSALYNEIYRKNLIGYIINLKYIEKISKKVTKGRFIG
jgi:hypothetical protein